MIFHRAMEDLQEINEKAYQHAFETVLFPKFPGFVRLKSLSTVFDRLSVREIRRLGFEVSLARFTPSSTAVNAGVKIR